MFSARQISVDTDISQHVIMGKIVAYLTHYQRSADIIKSFEKGQCTGFTSLALYSLFLLLTQPRRYNASKAIPRDDWLWVKKALSRISQWDGSLEKLRGKSRAKKKLRQAFERIISLIKLLQRPQILFGATQAKIHENLKDNRNRVFKKEYSFGSFLIAEDFIKPIFIKADNRKIKTTLLEALIKEDRLVFIPAMDHIIGVIKHQDLYFFYNSNAPHGWVVYTAAQRKELVTAFFAANVFAPTMPSPLSLIMVRMDGMRPEHYFSPSALLSALGKPSLIKSSDYYRPTALYLVATIGCRNLFYYHLNHPPIPLKSYVNLACVDGETPLHTAAYEGYEDMVKALLNTGAMPNTQTNKHVTAILFAVRHNHVGIVRRLLKAGADPNIPDNEKFSPLFLAARENLYEIMKLLLAYKARPNQHSVSGNTALHAAVWRGDLRAVKLLLAYRADVNAINNNGSSPLSLALQYEKMEVVDYLLRLPAIVVRQKEYNALVKLVKKYPIDEKLQDCFERAAPLLTIYLIKSQLKLFKKQHKKFYSYASCQLRLAKPVLATLLSPKEKIQFLVEPMLPIFSQAPKNSQTRLWPYPDISVPVIRQLEKWNISIQKIHPKAVINY